MKKCSEEVDPSHLSEGGSEAAFCSFWKLAVLAAFTSGVLILKFNLWQPRYQGETVRGWFLRACEADGMAGHLSEAQACAEAFVCMGTNAVPFLVGQMEPERRIADWAPLNLLIEWLRYNPRTPWWLGRGLPAMQDPWVKRRLVFKLLEAMGPSAIGALPALEQRMLKPDFGAPYDALAFIRSFGRSASNSAPVLVRLFPETNGSVSHEAVAAWGAISPPRSPLSSNLVQAVERGYVLASQAVPILGRLDIDFGRLLPFLRNELCSTNDSWHYPALAVCDDLQLYQDVLIPGFPLAIKDPDPRFRSALLQSLRQAGRVGRANLTTVFEALDDPYSYVRAEAAKTVLALDPDGDDSRTCETLEARRNDSSEYVAQTAQAALSALRGRGTAQGVLDDIIRHSREQAPEP